MSGEAAPALEFFLSSKSLSHGWLLLYELQADLPGLQNVQNELQAYPESPISLYKSHIESIWPSRSCSDYAVYILLIVFVYYHGHIFRMHMSCIRHA